jgi:hypothetical protein
MALRAFHANPCIGGFGGENTTPSLLRNNNRKSRNGHCQHPQDTPQHPAVGGNSGDAFCQIVKELVDNAVDAVNTSLQSECPSKEWDKKKRIRVEINPYPKQSNIGVNDANDTNLSKAPSDLLKIDVLDNGCGMENIQKCVDAFHSTKANSQSQGTRGREEGHSNTSGRYGIGLTLCLLHAQRLVPNSYTCITSTKKGMSYTSRALFVVDPENDAVVCHEEEQIPKRNHDESGTSVSLLFPSASANALAWERLCAYFSRFRLCPNLAFGLEVLAPTLAKIPIFIRPKPLNRPFQKLSGTNAKLAVKVTHDSHSTQPEDPLDIGSWEELNTDHDEKNGNKNEPEDADDTSDSLPPSLQSKLETRRIEIMDAAKEYWRDRKMALKNIAVSCQRIRAEEYIHDASNNSVLELEVNIIVCPLPSRNASDILHEDFNNEETSISSRQQHLAESEPASMELVRMVNDVPILDGAEAHSCGLVHGLAEKSVWASFGLDISRKSMHEPNGDTPLPSTGCKWTPTFELQDDSRVGAFVQGNANHRQLHCLVDEDSDLYDSDDESVDECKSLDSQARKRSALRQMDNLLPAGIRLHSILIVVRIQAAPSSLPLPTLSKGRLPLNHGPINNALHRGLNECLKSLQRTNPLLLLSPIQLSSVVRDVRYIPKLAKELALSVCEAQNLTFHKRAKEILTIASELTPTTKRIVHSQSSIDSNGSDKKVNVSHLSNAFLQVLTYNVQERLKALQQMKKSKKEEAKVVKGHHGTLEEEDYEEIHCGSADIPCSSKNKEKQNRSNGPSDERSHAYQRSTSQLSISSWKEILAESPTPSAMPQEEKCESDMSAASSVPMRAVYVALADGGVPIEDNDSEFDGDWL